MKEIFDESIDICSESWIGRDVKGGVIMDVVNAEQARIAEDAGACAVMALERVPHKFARMVA